MKKHKVQLTMVVSVEADDEKSLKEALKELRGHPPHKDSFTVGRGFVFAVKTPKKATVKLLTKGAFK